MSFNPDIHVPGLWRCAKCNFVLVQSNLNAADGTVTARDDAGDRCPNDNAPLWRVTWKEHAQEMSARGDELLERAVAAEGGISIDRHYLAAIRERLVQLYAENPNNARLREHISDELDWINEKLGDDGE